MTSSGNASDAAMKLFLAESFSKDSPHYEENVFQVRVKFKANSSFFFVYLLRSKTVNEVLEILDRIPTSFPEPNPKSSSMLHECNKRAMILMKILAHTLRLSAWNGNVDNLSSKT
jgi:hypothetical protein